MTIERHSIKDLHNLTAKRHKYGVSTDKSKRTYKGVVYHSRMEMLRAVELDRCGLHWTRQVPFWLGDDAHKFVVDFMVFHHAGIVAGVINYEEVKGVITPKDKKHWKMWAKYGKFTLRVIRLVDHRWVEIERIEPS